MKANEALVTNFKVTAMRRFLLEVKDPDISQSKWRQKVQCLSYQRGLKHVRVILHYQWGVDLANPMNEDKIHWNIYKGIWRRSDQEKENWKWDGNLMSVTCQLQKSLSLSGPCLSLLLNGAITAFACSRSSVASLTNLLSEKGWQCWALLQACWQMYTVYSLGSCAVWEMITGFSLWQQEDMPHPLFHIYLFTSVSSSELG